MATGNCHRYKGREFEARTRKLTRWKKKWKKKTKKEAAWSWFRW